MNSCLTILLTIVVSFSCASAKASSTATAPAPFKISAVDVVTQKEFTLAFPSLHPVAIVFISAKCPCSASHESLLKDLSVKFKDVTFLGIHSNADETKEETAAHFKTAQLPFPVIQDPQSTYANKWGALKTPHAFVLNTEGVVIYQGGVTDSHVGPSAKKQFLKEVLEDVTAGRAPRHKEGRALGCYIQRET